MKRLLACLVLVVSCAGSALGQSGVNFSWNDCGTFGLRLKAFACNTNSGSNRMVASFVAPPDVDALTGMEAVVDLCTGGYPLPEWWKFKNPGTCRQTALSASFFFMDSTAVCADYWQGRAVGGISAYQISFPDWDSARMKIVAAVPQAQAGPVDPTLEYYAFAAIINNVKTVGSGACPGCQIPACIVLNEIKLVQPNDGLHQNYRLSAPLYSQMLNWQGLVPGCPFIVPTRNATWGAIKSLYR